MASDSTQLGAMLARGWRSLPTELKLEVPSYIVPRQLKISFCYFNFDQRDPVQFQNLNPLEARWLSGIIFIPEFKELAIDMIRSQNIVEFNDKPDFNKADALKYYPNKVQHFRIVIAPQSHIWKWLARYARRDFGSTRLRTVEIIIDGRQAYASAVNVFLKQIK